MKNRFFSVIAIFLCVSMLLSGCILFRTGEEDQKTPQTVQTEPEAAPTDPPGEPAGDDQHGSTPFEEMEYARPDISELDDLAEECMDLAQTAQDVEVLLEPINGFYELYSGLATNHHLAFIHYAIDMTDSYWEEEYNYCSELTATAESLSDRLLHALADCDLRQELEEDELFGEGFFDDYTGQSVWTDEFTRLMEQETALQNRYYELSAQANAVEMFSQAYFDEYGDDMVQVYVQMIALRQQIAREAGYEDYPSFAYDFYFDRDYAPGDIRDYVADIQDELAPMYEDLILYGDLGGAVRYCSTRKTLSYVRDMAEEMGGVVREAFEHMEELGLYHIEPGDEKMASSFEVWLPDYSDPFLFVDPARTNSDQLTFAHEFGHFCNDYASFGSSVGIDVAEIFSQGLEYLSLDYAPDGEKNVKLKMADTLCVFVEQAAYASFELRVYELEDEALTAEAVAELFRQTMSDFGMGALELDGRSFVAISHFFTSPLYVISYVLSNDAALQIYQLEQEEAGQGLACYLEHLGTDREQLLSFLKSAGMESPFEAGRVRDICHTLEDILF